MNILNSSFPDWANSDSTKDLMGNITRGQEAGSAKTEDTGTSEMDLSLHCKHVSLAVPPYQVHKLTEGPFQFLLIFSALWFLGVCPKHCWANFLCGHVPKLKCILLKQNKKTLGQNLDDSGVSFVRLCKYTKEKTFVWNRLDLCQMCPRQVDKLVPAWLLLEEAVDATCLSGDIVPWLPTFPESQRIAKHPV